jgi:hypothetical protein
VQSSCELHAPPPFPLTPRSFYFPHWPGSETIGALMGSLFRKLIAYCSNVDGRLLKWMDNAILDTWIKAVVSNPSLCQVDAIPHSCFSALSPTAGNPKLLAIRLHQEWWALLSQLLWDQAFAMLSKQAHTLWLPPIIRGSPTMPSITHEQLNTGLPVVLLTGTTSTRVLLSGGLIKERRKSAPNTYVCDC